MMVISSSRETVEQRVCLSLCVFVYVLPGMELRVSHIESKCSPQVELRLLTNISEFLTQVWLTYACCELVFQFHTCGHQDFPAPFVEDTLCSWLLCSKLIVQINEEQFGFSFLLSFLNHHSCRNVVPAFFSHPSGLLWCSGVFLGFHVLCVWRARKNTGGKALDLHVAFSARTLVQIPMSYATECLSHFSGVMHTEKLTCVLWQESLAQSMVLYDLVPNTVEGLLIIL